MGLAFEKKFWEEALKDPFAIIVGGTCLHFGKETNEPCLKGFASSKFKFEILEDTLMYNKGDFIESTNVWYRGDVPDWCHVKNNAKFTEDSPTKIITKESKAKNTETQTE